MYQVKNIIEIALVGQLYKPSFYLIEWGFYFYTRDQYGMQQHP